MALILHRLIKIVVKNNITSYIARGDSNAFADDPVKIDKIAGRIVGAETTGENPVPADIQDKYKAKLFHQQIKSYWIAFMEEDLR